MLLLLAACTTGLVPVDEDTAPAPPSDADADGSPADVDCDDADPTAFPGADEACDGADDDCDGEIDEGALLTAYTDADGDGHGDPSTGVEGCTLGDGVAPGDDCDDTNPDVHPGSEAQVDGVDTDCDGRRSYKVVIYASVDDAFELCVDDEENILGGGADWPSGFRFETWLESGTHAIGVKGWDLGRVITAAIVHVELSDGTRWVSDGTWRYDPEPAFDASTRTGWCAPGFTDDAWLEAKEIGPIGTSPWGSAPSVFPPGSPALWIWDHYPVDLNTQYLRKELTLP